MEKIKIIHFTALEYSELRLNHKKIVSINVSEAEINTHKTDYHIEKIITTELKIVSGTTEAVNAALRLHYNRSV